MTLKARRSVGRRRSSPKELLGIVSAKRWYRWNWLSGLVTGNDVVDRILVVARVVLGRISRVAMKTTPGQRKFGRSLVFSMADGAGSRWSFLDGRTCFFCCLRSTEDTLMKVLVVVMAGSSKKTAFNR